MEMADSESAALPLGYAPRILVLVYYSFFLQTMQVLKFFHSSFK